MRIGRGLAMPDWWLAMPDWWLWVGVFLSSAGVAVCGWGVLQRNGRTPLWLLGTVFFVACQSAFVGRITQGVPEDGVLTIRGKTYRCIEAEKPDAPPKP